MPPCIGESNHEKRPDFLKIRRIETCPKAAKNLFVVEGNYHGNYAFLAG